MATENTLGAPTEGLGQRVTFKFDPGKGVPQMSMVERGPLKASVQGGDRTRINQAQSILGRIPSNPTMDLLQKATAMAIEGRIKQTQQEQFFRGMQKAAAGQAIQDIAAEQPWYSRIFGDTDLIEGARQYTANQRAMDVALEIEREMPEARKLTGKQAQDYFVQKWQSKMTGDPAADTALMQAMTRSLPGVMAAQTKANYAWLQEQAAAAEYASFHSGAEALQEAGRRAAQDETQVAAATAQAQQFIEGILPPAGRDVEAWANSITDNIKLLAKDGQFHAINTLRDAGLFDELPPAKQVQIAQAVEAGESLNRTRYTGEWAEEVSKVVSDAQHPPEDPENPGHTLSVAQIRDRVDAINLRYRTETGSSYDLIPYDKATSMYSSMANAIKQMSAASMRQAQAQLDAARTEQAKLAAVQRTHVEIVQAAVSGNLDALRGVPGVTPDMILQGINDARSMVPPDRQADLLMSVANSYGVPSGIQREFSNRLRAAITADPSGAVVANDAMPAAYAEWLMLHEHPLGEYLASKFYDADLDARMQKYHSIVSTNPQLAQAAFAEAFGQPLGKGERLSEKEFKELSKTMSKRWYEMPSWLGGREPLRDDALEVISRSTADQVAAYRGVVPTEEAVKNAVGRATGPGGNVEVVGGFAWQTPKGMKSLMETLREDRDGKAPVQFDPTQLASQAHKVILQSMKDHGIKESESIRIIRGPNQGNVATFIGFTASGDRMFEFTSETIYEALAKEEASMKKLPKTREELHKLYTHQ